MHVCASMCVQQLRALIPALIKRLLGMRGEGTPHPAIGREKVLMTMNDPQALLLLTKFVRLHRR